MIMQGCQCAVVTELQERQQVAGRCCIDQVEIWKGQCAVVREL